MKKFFAALLLISSAAFAAETVILDVPATDLGKFTRLESKMYVDMDNGQVSGILTSVLDSEVCRWENYGGGYGGGWGGRYPHPGPMDPRWSEPRYVCYRSSDVSAKMDAVIENLMVIDNQIILQAEAGDVNCGVIKRGRIFKNTIKIVLNGQCTVSDRLVNVDGVKRAQLVFVTK